MIFRALRVYYLGIERMGFEFFVLFIFVIIIILNINELGKSVIFMWILKVFGFECLILCVRCLELYIIVLLV